MPSSIRQPRGNQTKTGVQGCEGSQNQGVWVLEQRELQRSELKHPMLLFTSTYLPVLKLQWLKGLELKNKVQ